MEDPIVITDTREQRPLAFTHLKSEPGTLYSADYSIKGLEDLFGVERKSLNDCIGSLTSGRDRFERELHRLRGYQFARLLIIGARSDIEAGNYRSKMQPKAALNSLSAFEARYVPIIFSETPTEAALLVERWAYWFHREYSRRLA
jgi:ERCC4-type nuclease